VTEDDDLMRGVAAAAHSVAKHFCLRQHASDGSRRCEPAAHQLGGGFCCWLAVHPAAGGVVRASGGCRMVRWARACWSARLQRISVSAITEAHRRVRRELRLS